MITFFFQFVCQVKAQDLATATAAVEVAGQIKDLIKTEKSSHITTREKTPGFEFLNMYAHVQKTRGLKKRHILRVIKRRLRPFSKVDRRFKEVVDTLLEYIKDDVEEHQEQFFTILSKNGYGGTSALFVYYKLREDGKYNFKSMMFNGRFKLAATLVITRHAKSNFFGSSSKDVINWLPRRGITAKDINDLLNIIVPNINKIMEGFLPGDDSDE